MDVPCVLLSNLYPKYFINGKLNIRSIYLLQIAVSN
jgi:hypothetical protein